MSREDEENPMKWTVAEFLRQVHETIRAAMPGNPQWHELGRRDAEIADLGLNKHQVLDELLKVDVSRHHTGPEIDHHYPGGAVHIFKYPLDPGVDVYVKLSVRPHLKRHGIYIVFIYSFKRWT